MTFAVVAASYQHRERERSAPWQTVMAGLIFGGVAVFTGFVGILTMFGQREIIEGTLSLAHLTLGLSAFFAGLWATHTSSRPVRGFASRRGSARERWPEGSSRCWRSPSSSSRYVGCSLR